MRRAACTAATAITYSALGKAMQDKLLIFRGNIMLVLSAMSMPNDYSIRLLNAALPLVVLVSVVIITISPLATSLFNKVRLHGYKKPVLLASHSTSSALPMGKNYDQEPELYESSSLITINEAVPRYLLIIFVFACLSTTYLIPLTLAPLYGFPRPYLYLFDSLANMVSFMLATLHFIYLYHNRSLSTVYTRLLDIVYIIFESYKLSYTLFCIYTRKYVPDFLLISSLALYVSRVVILLCLAGLHSKFMYKKSKSVVYIPVNDTPVNDIPAKNIPKRGQESVFKRLIKLSPFLWPHHSWLLQFVASLCFVLLLIGRVVAMGIPLALKSVVTNLSQKTSPWISLLCYLLLYPLNGHGGIPSAVQSILWHVSVAQYCERAISQLVFEHLLDLSLSFHKKKKIGEVIRVLQRKESLNKLFETFLFKVVPIVFDVAIAIIYIAIQFGWVLAGIVFTVMTTYLFVTIQLSTIRIKYRREKNEEDKHLYGIETDAILNWESVKCFTAENFEISRYMKYFYEYQAAEFNVVVSLGAVLMIQSIIFSFATIFGCIFIAQEIIDNVKTIGDFVLFTSLLHQISVPLAMLANEYRAIQMRIINAEQLLNLLAEKPEIKDITNATTLKNGTGEIVFDNVSFQYEKNGKGVRNLSFKIPSGSSAAFVGESGGGKSTLFRLLYRFYDIDEGSIRIDGNDIREVTQNSLRSHIAIVPQEVGLANESLKHNIAYGNIYATDEQIIKAAKDAQIHDRILEFPDQYGTIAGEHGVRLSGGERQRIGIARALIKNPAVLLLDEATSAIDSTSALEIQNTLDEISLGKTTITIAHKLNTVATADQIFVMNDGEIVESGTHTSLLLRGGYYAKLWNDQLKENFGDQVVSSGAITPLGAAIRGASNSVLPPRSTTPEI